MTDIEIDITDEDFLIIAKEAHRQDISFNQLANKILKEAIEKG